MCCHIVLISIPPHSIQRTWTRKTHPNTISYIYKHTTGNGSSKHLSNKLRTACCPSVRHLSSYALPSALCSYFFKKSSARFSVTRFCVTPTSVVPVLMIGADVDVAPATFERLTSPTSTTVTSSSTTTARGVAAAAAAVAVGVDIVLPPANAEASNAVRESLGRDALRGKVPNGDAAATAVAPVGVRPRGVRPDIVFI